MHPASGNHRWLVEPLIGIVLVLIWAVGFSTRLVSFVPVRGEMIWSTTPYAFALVVGFAAAIALSRVATGTSLVLVGVLLAAQLLFWPARFSELGWSAYLMLLVFATLVGFHAARRMRMVAPFVLVLYAVVVSALLVLPRFSATSIDGLINGKHLSTVALIPDLFV